MSKVKMQDYKEWWNTIPQAHKYASSKVIVRCVPTIYGIVSAERFGSAHNGYTILRFVWNEKIYNRAWRCHWERRTIARLAREMAEDIAQRESSQGDILLQAGIER